MFDRAFELAMIIFERSVKFPAPERYSLTDQIRRSSRSVCANLAEGWQKRQYPAAFVAKLTDCKGEAADTIVWVRFADECGYVQTELAQELTRGYDQVIGMLIRMIEHPDQWTLPGTR